MISNSLKMLFASASLIINAESIHFCWKLPLFGNNKKNYFLVLPNYNLKYSGSSPAVRCWHALPDYNFRAFSLSEAEAAYIIIQSAERQKQSLPITTCGTSNNRQRRQGEWWPWLRFWTSFQPWRLFSQLSALLPAVIAFFCPPSYKPFADQMSWVVSDKETEACNFLLLSEKVAGPASRGGREDATSSKVLGCKYSIGYVATKYPTHTHTHIPAGNVGAS